MTDQEEIVRLKNENEKLEWDIKLLNQKWRFMFDVVVVIIITAIGFYWWWFIDNKILEKIINWPQATVLIVVVIAWCSLVLGSVHLLTRQKNDYK